MKKKYIIYLILGFFVILLGVKPNLVNAQEIRYSFERVNIYIIPFNARFLVEDDITSNYVRVQNEIKISINHSPYINDLFTNYLKL